MLLPAIVIESGRCHLRTTPPRLRRRSGGRRSCRSDQGPS